MSIINLDQKQDFDFKIRDDTLLCFTTVPGFENTYGSGRVYEVHPIIDKETFKECYKRWILEDED